ncbi:MAG: CPBP family glutamic-type intramembrane protease [Candidatus Eremiobacterota bacterium]
MFDYSQIAGTITIIVELTSFMIASMLFISFYGKAMEFRRPALIIALINTFFAVIKFMPFIFNWPDLTENLKNPEFTRYLTFMILIIPYDLIRLFIFITSGFLLYKYLDFRPLRREWKSAWYWLDILMTCIIFTGITESLVYFIHPVTSDHGRKISELMLSYYASKDIGSFHIASCAPWAEEVTWRFFWPALLLYLFRNIRFKWVYSIVITSALWSIGHAGMLNPEWMRFIQIFVYGLLLGWLLKKRGLEACLASHFMSNIILTAIHLRSQF